MYIGITVRGTIPFLVMLHTPDPLLAQSCLQIINKVEELQQDIEA